MEPETHDCDPGRLEMFLFTLENWTRWLFWRVTPEPHHRCEDCGKPDRRWWWPVGEHADCDCLPF